MVEQTQVLKGAGQDYAAAYAVHYKVKNLQEAFKLYRGVMTA